MKRHLFTILALLLCTFTAGAAGAHFGMLIPSDTMLLPGEEQRIKLTVAFAHPMEQLGMPMERPISCGVRFGGHTQDLSTALRKTRLMGANAWEADYLIARPGLYTFFFEPTPYWEEAENCFIVHYTKTVVAAYGYESGWDEPLGLETEIVPLARPFGIYAGNLFQGRVMLEGRPLPHATVEVEYYNQDKTVHPPTPYMITQVVKTDGNGVFSFTVPRPGWWGFAALSTAPRKIPRQGEAKDVELGAVIWVYFHPWEER